MGDENWTTKKINDWVAQGTLTRECILSRLDDRIWDSYAIPPEEKPILEAAFASACTRAPSGDGQVLTESAFISLLQRKAALPRCPEGVEAGRVIYASVAYLSTLPFPRHAPQPSCQLHGLSLAQLTRGLVWALPDRTKYIIEEGEMSRMRTRFDHQRLLFQSLATTTVPLVAQGEIQDRARLLARRHAFDVPEECRDMCVVNHDKDGDEIYHDLLDVLYSTQEVQHPGLSPVRRDAFRKVAKQIEVEEGIPKLHTLATPVQRLYDLVKVLLALQVDPEATSTDIGGLLHFNDAAQSICAAFTQIQDQTQDTSRNVEEGRITWPSFSHALSDAAPHLFDPLYRLLTLAFLDKSSPIDILDAPEPPHNIPIGAILTLPRVSQLVSFLAETIYAGNLQRMTSCHSPSFPTLTAFVQAIQNVPDEAIVLISGRSTITTPTSASPTKQGELCIFGLFSPAPKKDGVQIQAPAEVDPVNVGQQQCALFQLAPVQDVFRGVAGKAGWDVVADVEGGESVTFGGSDSIENQRGGVVLVLHDGLRRARIRHWGIDINSVEGRDDSKGKGVVYEASSTRGDWELEFIVEDIEIWSEVQG
ncbi:hypothetical protein F4804DRAFT_327737 [Jackrogersella minutella]|nr:hypothetical protein F4804DRAFT_327737 [Jackrogersella minutella]